MTEMTSAKAMPVSDLKRDFSSVLDAAERGEQTIVLRHGKPVAILGPVEAPESQLPKPRRRGGLLALVGMFEDWETMDRDMAEIVASRQKALDRPPPEFGS